MKDDRLIEHDDLADAFRSVRDAYDGTNAESNLTLQRALFRTRTRERRQRLTRWVVLPAAAVLVASTAWAGVTGKLAPALNSVLESFHAEHASPASPPTRPSQAAVTSSNDSPMASNDTAATPADAPPSTPEMAAEPSPTAALVPPIPAPVATTLQAIASRARSPVHGASAWSGVNGAPSPAVEAPSTKDSVAPPPSASGADPHAALFAEAHRLHFIDRDPARALAAWDRYLVVAPDGRFSPEARYNRALALVRLGRHTEAQTELNGFANGTYGNYRREEAKALLAALAHDPSRP